MSQEYTIISFKSGDFKDNFGNTWCEVAFEELSEPARWVVKDPSRVSVGQKVYGHIEDAVSKAGKPYNRFKTDKREDYSPTQSSSSNSGQSTDESIARAVALKAAVELTASDARLMKDKATVLEIADRFLEWLKGTTPSERPATQAPDKPQSKWQEAGSKLHDDLGNVDMDDEDVTRTAREIFEEDL